MGHQRNTRVGRYWQILTSAVGDGWILIGRPIGYPSADINALVVGFGAGRRSRTVQGGESAGRVFG